MLKEKLLDFSGHLTDLLPLEKTEISNLFEKPKNKDHGHTSLPVFRFSKTLKKAPPVLAKEVAEQIINKKIDGVKEVQAVGGFINITWTNGYILENFKEFINEEKLGYNDSGKGRKLIIDYSSPNVAKPMHVGHLRATIIGQAIRNLAQTQGFEVIGLNHLGDWGVQFGKLAWAYKKWGSEYDFKNDSFNSLYSLYVRFHKEVEEHPEYEKEGAAAFKRLEEGDEELHKIWKEFIDISMAQYQKTWDRLGVKHDLVKGESFYADPRKLDHVVDLLEKKELLEESEGAWVVHLDEKRPPCLIKKSDGASLYATRDIASALYRMQDLECDVNLYVVGSEQKLHFSQLFSVLEKMDYPWAKDCHHVAFGMYRFKNVGKMSSRKGQVIRLDDVLDKATEMVLERINSKNPDLKNKDDVAEIVGVGAVVFNDLLNDRVKDVEFDWEKVTDFEGDSGPYVQYSAVRCKSLLRKAKEKLKKDSFDFAVTLSEKAEIDLMNLMMDYPNILSNSYKTFKPNYLASFLLEVSRAFSSFYNKCPILSIEDKALMESRLALVSATLKVLEEGLKVLNITSPEEM